MDFLFATEVFMRVVEHGSFAHAAAPLKLTPGMVSRHIAALESHLGARLFFRTTHRLVLTDSGTVFLERCNRIHARINAATGLFAPSGAISGIVTVEVTNTMANGLVLPVWDRFTARYPNIRLELYHTQNAYSRSYDGFDVMFRLGSVDDAQVVKHRLGDTHAVVAASGGYLAGHGAISTPGDLRRHDCVRYIDPITLEVRPWTFERQGEVETIQPNGTLLFNQAESTVHAALCGLGVVYTTNYHANRYIRAGRLTRVLEDWTCPAPDVWLVCRRSGVLPQATHAFVEFMVQEYPEGKPFDPLDRATQTRARAGKRRSSRR